MARFVDCLSCSILWNIAIFHTYNMPVSMSLDSDNVVFFIYEYCCIYFIFSLKGPFSRATATPSLASEIIEAILEAS